MSESGTSAENSHDGLELDGEEPEFLRKCCILGNITNHHENRAFFHNQLSKRKHKSGENAEFEAEEAKILSQLSSCGVESLHKGKDVVGSEHSDSENISADVPTTDHDNNYWYLLKTKRHCLSTKSVTITDYSLDNFVADISQTSPERKELSTSLSEDLHFMKYDAANHGNQIILGDNASRDGSASGICTLLTNHDSLPSLCCKSRSSSLLGEKAREEIQSDHTDASWKEHVPSSYDNSQFVEPQVHGLEGSACLIRLTLDETSRCGGSRQPSLPDPKMVNLQQMLKEHDGSDYASGFNPDDSNASEKTCSCSFCMKAAYLWSELHYQDMRGRLAALRRSRKQVRLLVGRCYDHDDLNGNDHNVHVAGEKSNSSAELESNLRRQWRSLFLHTEDALVHESSQLQSSLHSLKELRKNCKWGLERVHSLSSDKP